MNVSFSSAQSLREKSHIGQEQGDNPILTKINEPPVASDDFTSRMPYVLGLSHVLPSATIKIYILRHCRARRQQNGERNKSKIIVGENKNGETDGNKKS